MDRRVVITGSGVVSSLGMGVEEFWRSIRQGENGISTVERIDTTNMSTKVAAEIKNFDATNYIDRKEAKRMDRFTQFAVVAAQYAVENAGIDFSKTDAYRTGVIIGSGVGGLDTLEEQHRILLEKGANRVSPVFIPMMISNMASANIAIKYGIKGFNECVVTACASSTNAIGDAFKVIQRGSADVIIAGGAEAALTPISFAGFCSMKAMSVSVDPSNASKPFDAERNGFVMGEGAAVIILEEYNHAINRGAKILCEIVGYGCTNDAYHITAPAPGGEGAARCMKNALDDAGINPEDVGYINAHGTSTDLNDKLETAAIKMVFGDHAGNLAISSSKSMTGHLLGAAGALEAIVSGFALKEGFIPPTINYKVPDPECDLDYVPNEGRKADLNYVISNSLGFGGHNATIALKKV